MENQENQGKVLMNKYEVGRLLGQGTFAKVYFARDLKTGRNVAIKAIDKDKIKKVGIAKQTKREISVMGLVKHNNIMQLYEVMATKTKIYFVMEYAKGGELFHKVAKGKLKEDVARKYFQQLICAIKFCHSRGVYHRDLKLENLLLDDDENLKVTDFGLSALPESRRSDGLFHTTCGTPAYVAPEVIGRKGYDAAKADIWSCGVILFVLIAGYLPFFDSNLLRLYEKIGNGEYKFPKWFTPEVRALLSRILDPNPDTRISIAEIMENSWFRNGLDSELSKNSETIVGKLEKSLIDSDSVLDPSTFDHIDDAKVEPQKVYNLNAFDIISLSTGLNLSGLFVSYDQKDEVQFTSTKPASTIISKMEEIAKHLKLELVKKDQGSLKLERSNGIETGNNITINVEIFEISPSFHLVEVKKSSGDSIEFQSMLKEKIRPGLREIVWAWQGEQKQI